MKRILLLVLFVFVSGCCCLPGGREAASTTRESTTTLAGGMFLERTTVLTSTTTRESFLPTTTLPVVSSMPEYVEGDLWSYVERVEEGEFKPYERTIELGYRGVDEDSGQSVFDRRFYGVRVSPGQSVAMALSTLKEYYKFKEGKWVLEKTVAYPKASTGGYTTVTYTPGRVVLAFPLEAGAGWNGSSELSARQLNRLLYKLRLDYRSSVTGVREVSTTAGVFNCVEVETFEEQYLVDRLIQASRMVYYYCPDLKQYASWSTEVTLPSGKSSDKVRIPQYQTVLEPQRQNNSAQLTSYKTT